MNLARVEHYFADFLSLLENRTKAPEIPLYTAYEERHVVVEQGIFLEIETEARRRSDRKSVVQGKSWSVRVDLCGRRLNRTTHNQTHCTTAPYVLSNQNSKH